MTGTASMHVPLHHVRAHPMPHIKLRAELTAGLMTWGESRKHICEMRFIVMINGNSFIFYLKNCFKLIGLGTALLRNRDNGKAETYPIWVHGFISWWMCVFVMVLCVCIFQHSDVGSWFYKSDMKIIEIDFFPWEPCFECIQKVIDPFRH